MIKIPKTWVKPHFITRNGKRIKIKGHWRKTVGSKAKGRSGERFKKLAKEIEREYIKKGYSKKRAREIGRATAGKVFWQKFGKERGKRILRRER